MLEERLSELRRQLIEQGHSVEYSNRLCDELRDHALSEIETSLGVLADRQADLAIACERLGSVDVLAHCAQQQLPADSFAIRHPDLACVALPGGFFLLYFWLNAAVLWQLSQIDGIQHYRTWVVSGASILQWGVVFGLGALASYLAGPRPLLQVRSWCLLSLLTLMCWIEVQWVGCSNLSNGLFRLHWELDLARMVAPWAGALSVPLITSLSGRRSLSRATIAPRLGWRLAVSSLLLASLFVGSIPCIRQAAARHPFDNIVLALNRPLSIAQQRISLLRDKKTQSELGLTQQQLLSLEQSLSEFDQALAELSKSLATGKKAWQPLDANWAAVPTAVFIQAQFENLRPEQQAMLDRALVRESSAEALMLVPIRNHLQLTESQQQHIKDLLLECQLEKQRCLAQLISGPPESRADLQQRQQAVQETCNQKVWSLLTARQVRRLHELPAIEIWHELK